LHFITTIKKFLEGVYTMADTTKKPGNGPAAGYPRERVAPATTTPPPSKPASPETARPTPTTTTGQVQEKAKEVAHQAQEQAKSVVATRKEQAVDQLDSVAQAFRRTGAELRNQQKDTIAGYTEQLADQVERLSGYLEQRDVGQLLHEAEDIARRQPALFLGGAFMLGLLVGRFIKSSGERRRYELARQEYNERVNYPVTYQSNYPTPGRPSAFSSGLAGPTSGPTSPYRGPANNPDIP
jgi:hypothetical protein